MELDIKGINCILDKEKVQEEELCIAIGKLGGVQSGEAVQALIDAGTAEKLFLSFRHIPDGHDKSPLCACMALDKIFSQASDDQVKFIINRLSPEILRDFSELFIRKQSFVEETAESATKHACKIVERIATVLTSFKGSCTETAIKCGFSETLVWCVRQTKPDLRMAGLDYIDILWTDDQDLESEHKELLLDIIYALMNCVKSEVDGVVHVALNALVGLAKKMDLIRRLDLVYDFRQAIQDCENLADSIAWERDGHSLKVLKLIPNFFGAISKHGELGVDVLNSGGGSRALMKLLSHDDEQVQERAAIAISTAISNGNETHLETFLDLGLVELLAEFKCPVIQYALVRGLNFVVHEGNEEQFRLLYDHRRRLNTFLLTLFDLFKEANSAEMGKLAASTIMHFKASAVNHGIPETEITARLGAVGISPLEIEAVESTVKEAKGDFEMVKCTESLGMMSVNVNQEE